MSYQNIDSIVQRKVAAFQGVLGQARTAAQRFFDALELALFVQGTSQMQTNPMIWMERKGSAWQKVTSSADLNAIEGQSMEFGVGVCFFDSNGVEIAQIVLPVLMTVRGEDAIFAFGEDCKTTSESSMGDYTLPGHEARNLIGTTASGWLYDHPGAETIIVR